MSLINFRSPPRWVEAAKQREQEAIRAELGTPRPVSQIGGGRGGVLTAFGVSGATNGSKQ
jgi:hypothetical protein